MIGEGGPEQPHITTLRHPQEVNEVTSELYGVAHPEQTYAVIMTAETGATTEGLPATDIRVLGAYSGRGLKFTEGVADRPQGEEVAPCYFPARVLLPGGETYTEREQLVSLAGIAFLGVVEGLQKKDKE